MKIKYSKTEQNEQKHFNETAKGYDKNYNYLQPFTKYKISKKSSEFVNAIKEVNSKRGISILEIGCGTGEYTIHISRLFPKAKITALDISENMINAAKVKCIKCKNVKFVVSSAYSTKFKDRKFDIVCGFYVLHHLDVRRIAQEVYRILNSRGLMYFFEPNILNPIVYLIKSNKNIKKMVGDSPDEWAINPIKISREMKGFRQISVTTSEFIPPINLFPLDVLKIIDKFMSNLSYIPIFRYLGGSVQLLFQKK